MFYKQDYIQSPSIGYKIQKLLGQGATGTVFLCVDLQTNNSYALKKVSKEFEGERKIAEFLKGRQFEHVVNFIDVFEEPSDKKNFYIVMEYCNSDNLFTILHQEKKKIQQSEAKKIMLQVSKGIQELHRLNIVHRDIKPENIISHRLGVGSRSEVIYKICDLGISKAQEIMQTRDIGTAYYMAPELLEGNLNALGPGIDIWAIGIVFYEVLKGETYFQGSSQLQIFEAIRITNQDFLSNKIQQFDTNIQYLLKGMIQKDLSLRIGIEEVIKRLTVKIQILPQNQQVAQNEESKTSDQQVSTKKKIKLLDAQPLKDKPTTFINQPISNQNEGQQGGNQNGYNDSYITPTPDCNQVEPLSQVQNKGISLQITPSQPSIKDVNQKNVDQIFYDKTPALQQLAQSLIEQENRLLLKEDFINFYSNLLKKCI